MKRYSNLVARLCRTSSALAMTALLGAAPAMAQAADDTDRAAEDVITVTAQRREQSILDVGMSLTAVPAAALERNNVLEVGDMGDLVPNLEIGTPGGAFGQPAIFLRGVGLNDFNSNNSGPIAVYFDEVYKSAITGQNFLLYDIDQIEVVKGPQGTLYGRNATGGALRVITAKPQHEAEAAISGSWAEYGQTRYEAMLNAPLGEHAAFRIAGMAASGDGYYTNVIAGSDTGAYDVFSIRAHLDFDLTPDLHVLLSVEASGADNDQTAYSNTGLIDLATGNPCSPAQIAAGGCGNALGYPVTTGRFETAATDYGAVDSDGLTASAVVTWNVGAVTLTSVTGFEHVARDQFEDADATPVSLLTLALNSEADTWSQEFRLNYSTDRSDFTAGIYYLSGELVQDQFADLFREVRPLIEMIDPVNHPGGFDPTGQILGAPVAYMKSDNIQQTDAMALFGQYEHDLGERWRLTLGARYSSEERTFDTVAALEEPLFTVPLYDTRIGTDDDNISWRLGLDWKPDDSLLVYGSISTGFKSGGFNGGLVLDPLQVVPYGPETITAYELGLRGENRAAGLRYNAAAFYYDYSDIQVFTFINSGGVPTNVLTNAGQAEIYGVEADVQWQANDYLSLNGAIGLLDASFTEFPSDAVLGTADYTGNTLPNSPEMSLSAGAYFEAPVGASLVVAASLNASYQSEVYFDTSNDPLLGQEGYGLLNASLALGAEDGRWRASLFGTNLTDEDYTDYAIDFSDFGYIQSIAGAPRVIGLRLEAAY